MRFLVGLGSDPFNNVVRRVGSFLGYYLPIRVDVVVHLDRRLLFGRLDGWGGGLGGCAAPSVAHAQNDSN